MGPDVRLERGFEDRVASHLESILEAILAASLEAKDEESRLRALQGLKKGNPPLRPILLKCELGAPHHAPRAAASEAREVINV